VAVNVFREAIPPPLLPQVGQEMTPVVLLYTIGVVADNDVKEIGVNPKAPVMSPITTGVAPVTNPFPLTENFKKVLDP
jgi:hypothetical protein